MDVRTGDSCHIASHTELVDVLPVGYDRPGTIDAIIVPTIRPVDYLVKIGDFARRIGCRLVALCSTLEQTRTVNKLLHSVLPPNHAAAVHVSDIYDLGLFHFQVADYSELAIGPATHIDIARKRNFGLLLARLCGWRTVAYLDDDISGLNEATIARAASMIDGYDVVGFRISEFPDNSVVCHANRLSGRRQDTFIGGVMIVNAERVDTFFPPVYNEDWLFLFDVVQANLTAVAGLLSQDAYNPFAFPRRAVLEEFGDLIAEGLYRLLHEGLGVESATYSFWRDAINLRSTFIDEIAWRLERMDGYEREVGRALGALKAAKSRLELISPLSCASFVHTWRHDLDSWRDKLALLPEGGFTVPEALILLDDLNLQAVQQAGRQR